MQTPSATVNYKVDALPRRASRLVSSAVTSQYIYNNRGSLMTEMSSTGTIQRHYVYGSKTHVPDYMISGGVKYRLISDHLGSVRLVVNTTSGAVSQEIEYDEYGQVLSDSNPGFQAFGFAGGMYDSDTGLVHFGARDYDPEVGRWITKDPILFKGGDTNLYGYVVNDPVNFVDPIGLYQTLPYGGAGGGGEDFNYGGGGSSSSSVAPLGGLFVGMVGGGLALATSPGWAPPLAMMCISYPATCTSAGLNAADFADSFSGEMGGPTTGLPPMSYGGAAGTVAGWAAKRMCENGD